MKLRALVIAVALFAALPANAHTASGKAVVWKDAIPCAWSLYCGSWQEDFTACETPFPPGSYVDVVTDAAPAAPPGKITILRVVLYSEVDWDLFICASPRGVELAQGSTHLGEPCDTLLGPNTSTFFGCHEDASIPRSAGQTSILRAYNWLDVFPAQGRYWYEFL